MSFQKANRVSQPHYTNMSTSRKRKYHVQKEEVHKGSEFLEDRYKPLTENIIGIWVKYGQGIKNENPAAKELKCKSCLASSKYYREKEEIIDLR